MKNELSLLFDDELDADMQPVVLAALQTDPQLRAVWGEYQQIGDALRRTHHLELDLTARVMAGLQHEPTILAPSATVTAFQRQAANDNRWYHGVLRAAAAVAGVAVVGWLALSAPAPSGSVPGAGVAREALVQTDTPAAVQTVAATSPIDADRLQPYLMAHQAYSPGNRFDGGTGYVRTVATIR